jgi:hypothetical protein
MNNQHTPGPWVYEYRSGEHPQSNNKWGTTGLWGPNGERIFNSGTGWEPHFEEPSPEDARLIEASPDLLELARLIASETPGMILTLPTNNQNASKLIEFRDAARRLIDQVSGVAQ